MIEEPRLPTGTAGVFQAKNYGYDLDMEGFYLTPTVLPNKGIVQNNELLVNSSNIKSVKNKIGLIKGD